LETLASQFESDSRLADLLDDFQPRPGQLKLADRIAACLQSGTDLVAEAATGTGKTLAYLLPALTGTDKVIISTGTLNLQDQLFQRDLPLALKAVGVEKSVALLKGRANYLCPQRMDKAEDGPGPLDDETGRHLEAVRRWARHTTTGEIRELAEIPERARVWPLVT